MDVTIAVLILTAGFVAERFILILNRARERAERGNLVIARLACHWNGPLEDAGHYAGRRAE